MGIGRSWIQYLPDAPGINAVEVPWTDGVTYSFTLGQVRQVPSDLAADLLRASAAKFKAATDPSLAAASAPSPAEPAQAAAPTTPPPAAAPVPVAPAFEAGTPGASRTIDERRP